MKIVKFHPSHNEQVRHTKWGWLFECNRCGQIDFFTNVCREVVHLKKTDHSCREAPFKEYQSHGTRYRVCQTCGKSYEES